MQKSSSDIKISLLQHSQSKVSLYGAYLSVYLNILSRSKHFTNILLFDLLCGEGLYERDSKGSPLVALQKIEEHYDQNPESPLKITVVFNDNGFSEIEKGVKKIERLKSIIDSENTPINTTIEYYEKDFEQILSESIERVRSSFNPKALFFIDPYGYKNIKPRHIKKLLSLKNTEAILFLPASHMYRFANRCLESPFCGSEPLHDFLIELFSNSPPSFDSSIDFIERCKRQFEIYLSSENILVDSFSIERNRSNTYCLFFFTSNILGFEKMLEEKWKIDTEQGKGFKLTHQQMGIFDSVDTSDYPKILEAYIAENSPVTNKDIYYFGLKNRYLPKHSKQVLKSLEDSGKLITESLDGKPIRGYYISYKNYRDPPERRIAFRIKKR